MLTNKILYSAVDFLSTRYTYMRGEIRKIEKALQNSERLTARQADIENKFWFLKGQIVERPRKPKKVVGDDDLDSDESTACSESSVKIKENVKTAKKAMPEKNFDSDEFPDFSELSDKSFDSNKANLSNSVDSLEYEIHGTIDLCGDSTEDEVFQNQKNRSLAQINPRNPKDKIKKASVKSTEKKNELTKPTG